MRAHTPILAPCSIDGRHVDSDSDDADNFVTPPARKRAAAAAAAAASAKKPAAMNVKVRGVIKVEKKEEEVTTPPPKKQRMSAAKKRNDTSVAKKRIKTRSKLQGGLTQPTFTHYDGGNVFDVGNLVMGTAKAISHPAMDKGAVHPSYIFLGVVVGHRVRDWFGGKTCDLEMVEVNWMNVEVDGIRYQDLKDERPTYSDNGQCFNIYVDFNFVHKDKIQLVATKKCNKVDKHNDFVERMVWANFWHGSLRGWSKILLVD